MELPMNTMQIRLGMAAEDGNGLITAAIFCFLCPRLFFL